MLPALVALQVVAAPVQALELNGQTWFTRPPWKVDFTNYYAYVGQTGATYYFTLTLPEEAGAGLGGLVIQQTRGVDRNFQFAPERTKAFVGRPRREGASIPVQAQFDENGAPGHGAIPPATAAGANDHPGAQALEQPLPGRHLHVCGAGASSRPQSRACLAGVCHDAHL